MYILCLSSGACQSSYQSQKRKTLGGKACSGDAASEEEKKSVNVGKVIQWTERATAQHLNGAGPDGFVSKKKPAPSPKQCVRFHLCAAVAAGCGRRTTSCCDAAKRDPCSANSQAAKQLKRGCWCRMDVNKSCGCHGNGPKREVPGCIRLSIGTWGATRGAVGRQKTLWLGV
ncbi:hypothetical protein CI102_12166 [Trichoderma harzianum]|nr:hypothetical protein CI102_12166 [Trichoderma harzianum]